MMVRDYAGGRCEGRIRCVDVWASARTCSGGDVLGLGRGREGWGEVGVRAERRVWRGDEREFAEA